MELTSSVRTLTSELPRAEFLVFPERRDEFSSVSTSSKLSELSNSSILSCVGVGTRRTTVDSLGLETTLFTTEFLTSVISDSIVVRSPLLGVTKRPLKYFSNINDQAATTHIQTERATQVPCEATSDTTIVFFPPDDGRRKSINLQANAAGTGVLTEGSRARAKRRPTKECPSDSPIRTTPRSNQKLGNIFFAYKAKMATFHIAQAITNILTRP
mmetsp:Transcript_486/g.886  ORF Transcript_486/g.886 Transcript_486/m.886 type:complete len:214 (-) Transcript_486:1267-1908(-)